MNIRSICSCSALAALSVSAVSPLCAALQNPKPLSQVAPAYAIDLRESGLEGEVVVSFTVTSTGEVRNPVVVSSTDRALEKPTLAAVRKWKFAPAMNDGVAVSVKVVQPVAYVIPELHDGSPARIVVSEPRPASQQRNATSAN
jgi:TonB family protein